MSLSSLPTLLLIPPLNCLVAAITGALTRSRALLWTGLAGLLLLSIPLAASALTAPLAWDLPTRPGADDPPQAIVILAGNAGRVRDQAGEHDDIGWLTLERERAGAGLARRTGLPVLVSGGAVRPGATSYAALMAASLQADFGVPVRWQEARSDDTWENAAESAAILRRSGIGRVYVVTHAWHMRRALIAFRAAGLQAVAAPVPEALSPDGGVEGFIPRVSAWGQSYFAIHEWIGCAWYGVRAWRAHG